MPTSGFSGSFTGPKVDVAIDMGNPVLNITVDGFLKIGVVAASRRATEDAYHAVSKASIGLNTCLYVPQTSEETSSPSPNGVVSSRHSSSDTVSSSSLLSMTGFGSGCPKVEPSPQRFDLFLGLSKPIRDGD